MGLPRFHLLALLSLGAISLAPWVRAEPTEDLASCRVDADPLREFRWMVTLDREIEQASGLGNPLPLDPQSDAETEIEPVVYADDETPAPESYDLGEPLLTRLRKNARKAARKCRRHICGDRRSKGLCYRGVKEALQKSGMVSRYLPGSHATLAHSSGILSHEGFRNIIPEGYTAAKAPLGAILVYSGGRHGYGHIEIKLGQREFCSDFCKTQPGNAYLNRRLIGIYVKPTQ